jgi:addiction module HigA family antidote
MESEFNLDEITLQGQIVPEHPGVLFGRFFVRRLSIPRKELPLALGISRHECDALLEGKIPVTRQLARSMSDVVGNDPDFWERMQSIYNFWHKHTQLAIVAPRL